MSNDKINLLNLIKDEGLKNLSYKLGKPNLFELIGLQLKSIYNIDVDDHRDDESVDWDAVSQELEGLM